MNTDPTTTAPAGRPTFDLAASLDRLAKWLKARKANPYDYSEDARRHRGLANRLKSMAAQLESDEWFYLELQFDKDPPPAIGADGYPVPSNSNNASRYKTLCWSLRELADTAERMAADSPKPKSKPELSMAADFFLHLWHEAGKDRPTLYDKSEAVIAFGKVLESAGNNLSPERTRGILADALARFDPHYCLDWWQIQQLMAPPQ